MANRSAPDTHALDRGFHALADATRRGVIARLAQGQASVADLAAPYDMALPSFLQHVRVLEDAGLADRIRAAPGGSIPVSLQSPFQGYFESPNWS